MIEHRITIVNVRKPKNPGVNEELQRLGHMLGLFGERDRDRSCFRIFVQLIKAKKQKRVLSSDELAEFLNLSRGTVVHHINHMIGMGLIDFRNRRYELRGDSLEHLVFDIRQDVEEALEGMKKAAEELDNMLNL